MNPIEQLRADARAKRDQTIRKARLDYRLAMRDIRAVERKLRHDGTIKPRYTAFRRQPVKCRNHSCRSLTVTAAAELILREGKPLTYVELTLEIQRRGCRTNDDPMAVLCSIKSAFRYHRDKFKRDGESRWSLIS